MMNTSHYLSSLTVFQTLPVLPLPNPDPSSFTTDRNFSISCELGMRYPSLQAMMNQEDLHLRV
jgi:hypothetical protein